MLSVDLNCDMGESFGVYTLGCDEEIIKYVSSVNIACGFHAGDPAVMQTTTRLAKEYGKAVGAHPGFPDLSGFGRRNLAMSPEEVRAALLYQIGALNAFCRAAGVTLRHVKPHGALYNLAAEDRKLAEAVALSIKAFDPELILVGLAGSQLIEAGQAVGLPVAREVFADRGYHADGSLVSRRGPQGVIHDPELVTARIVRLVREGKVTASNGADISLAFETICLHGDTPGAAELAAAVSRGLNGAGVKIAAL